jgi:Domain of unknown function (DUF1735)
VKSNITSRKIKRMKNIKMNNLKKIKIASLALGVFFLGSCLKDTGPVQDYSQSPALVSFQFKGGSQIPLTASLPVGTDDIFVLEVTLSVPSVTLGSAVTATLSVDDESLTAYNDSNGTAYTMVPADKYTIDGAGAVTIKAGQQFVSVNIHFNANAIDFSVDPALALKITSATGAKIASNLNVAIIPLKLRNIYEGNYNVTGFFCHPSAPRAINMQKTLTTVTATASEGGLGDLGSSFQFDVDGSNNLINWVPTNGTNPASGFINGVDNAVGNTVPTNYPGPPFVHTTYNNTYDPATSTFWMHYGYNGSNPAYSREIYEEWVLAP